MSETPQKKRKIIPLREKREILDQFESGIDLAEISRRYGYNYTTVTSICKRDKEKIRMAAHNVDNFDQNISKKIRPAIMSKMESMLYVWIQDMNQKEMPLSRRRISSKSLEIFNLLKESGFYGEGQTFTASRGWYQKFNRRYQLHLLTMNKDLKNGDREKANEFVKNLPTEMGGQYSLQQIINVDETMLIWKKVYSNAFVASNERLTLLLGGNANGDLKLKPFLIYDTENPPALKDINKENLGVYWRYSERGWMTAALFVDWIQNCLVNELKTFSQNKNVPFKYLVLIDNVPGHSNIEYLNSLYSGIKFRFFPSNATSLIQPMGQGIISMFKSYYLKNLFQAHSVIIFNENMSTEASKELWKKYSIAEALDHIVSSWNEVSENCMRGSWNKIFPGINATHEKEFQIALNDINHLAANVIMNGFENDDIMDVLNDTCEYSIHELQAIVERENNIISETPEILEISDLVTITDDSETDEPDTQMNRKDVNKILDLIHQLKNKIDKCDPDISRRLTVNVDLKNIEKMYTTL